MPRLRQMASAIQYGSPSPRARTQARSLPLLLTWILLTPGCGHLGLHRAPATLQRGALPDLSFREGLTQKDLRENYLFLSDADFKQKLEGSLESSLLFFRSWVNTYYHDLARANLGPVELCLGDPHPENFGFIGFDQGARFVFNDLDDSGECPVGADALRYFTALRLSESAPTERDLLEEAISLYARLVQREGQPVQLAPGLIPDLESKRVKLLREYTRGKRFSRDSGVEPVHRELERSIRRAIEDGGHLAPGAEVLSVGSIPHETGGSGGLKRYWLLITSSARPDDAVDILELKQVPPAGVSMGGWPQETSAGDPRRFDRMMKAFWPGLSARQLGGVRIGRELYFLRSRTKAGLKLEKLDPHEFRNAILSEVSLLARYHRRLWAGAPPDEEWLKRNSAILASRFQALRERIRK